MPPPPPKRLAAFGSAENAWRPVAGGAAAKATPPPTPDAKWHATVAAAVAAAPPMLLSRSSKDLLGNIHGPPKPSRDRSSSASTVESSPARRPSVDATAGAIAAALSGRKASDLHVPSSEGDLHVDAPPNFERKSSVLIERALRRWRRPRRRRRRRRPWRRGSPPGRRCRPQTAAAALGGGRAGAVAAAVAADEGNGAGRRRRRPRPRPGRDLHQGVRDGRRGRGGGCRAARAAKDWSFEAVVAQLAAVADPEAGAAGVDGW